MIIDLYKKYEKKTEDIAHFLWGFKVLQFVEGLMISLFFAYGIKALTDINSVYYQVHKYAAICKAMVAFMGVIFILRKVRLLNLPSLIATLAFLPFAKYHLDRMVDAPDNIAILKPQMTAGWLALMVIVDYLFYKRNNILRHLRTIPFYFYLLVVIVMFAFSHGRKEGFIMLMPIFFLFVTPMTEDKWRYLVKRVCDGWLIVYGWIMAKSFMFYYPYITPRFYGCFTNIGPFGAFILCSMMISAYGFYYLIKQKKTKSFMMVANVLWMLSIFYVTALTYTITMLLGIAAVIVGLWLFAAKDTSRKMVLTKIGILVGFMAVCMVILSLAGRNAAEMVEYWNDRYQAHPRNMIYYSMFRFYRSFVLDTDYSGIASMGLLQYDGLLQVLNNFSSGRIYIWQEYAKNFSWTGNPSAGLQVGNYFAYNAHCEYVELLYRYGYVGGLVNIAFYLFGAVVSIKRYLADRKDYHFLSMLWFFGMLGMWIGEINSIFYPITFTGVFLMYPIICRFRRERAGAEPIDKKDRL